MNLQSDETAEPVSRIPTDSIATPSIPYRIGIALFYVSFGFDFKDRGYIENPEVIRSVIVIGSLVGFFLALTARGGIDRQRQQSSHLNAVFGLWAFFAIYLVLITAFRSQELFDTIRFSAPFVYMMMSMFLIKRHIEAGYRADVYWAPIVAMCLVSLAWTFYFGRYASNSYNDEDLFAFVDGVKYTILSSALLPMFALTIFGLSRSKKIILHSLVLICITLLFTIAKSRGVLLGIFLVALYTILTSPNRLKVLVVTAVVSVVALSLAFIISEMVSNLDIIAVWKFRLFGLDDRFFDFTAYTRLAEYYGQINALLSDVQSAIFGYGYLQSFYWDERIFVELLAQGFIEDFDKTYTPGGHSAWLTSLYQGGLLAGWIPFASMTYMTILAFRIALSDQWTRRNLSDWGGVAFGIFVILWLPGNLGTFFIDRILPMIIGAAMIQATHEHYRLKMLKLQKT